MITSWIAWLPAFIALAIGLIRSPQKAFYSVYLPVLLLLPAIYLAITPGFPLLTFHQTTIIPITLLALFSEGSRWRWTLTDFLVLIIFLIGVYSETINEDFHEGINRTAITLCNIVGPYICGKALIHPKKLTIPFAKRFAFLMAVNIVLGLYELRMTAVPQVFVTGWFFPGQDAFDWPPLYRFGFVRMSGPFMSAIFFGIAVTMALLLHYWLMKLKLANKRYQWLELAILIFGLIFSFSRGPWLAALLSSFLAGAAFSRHLKKSLLLRFALVTLAAIILFNFFLNYQTLPTTETEGTILYRANLWQKYQAAIQEKFWFGWGLKNFPSEGGMASIDNNFLYIWILNGFSSLLVFIAIIFWGSIRLVKKGILSGGKAPLTSTLAIIFFSIYVSFTIVFLTVYMGLQVEPLFYLFVGWSEGFILDRKQA